MNKLRFTLAAMLIVSMLGLSVFNLAEGNWKAFVLGLLYSAANVIIFIV